MTTSEFIKKFKKIMEKYFHSIEDGTDIDMINMMNDITKLFRQYKMVKYSILQEQDGLYLIHFRSDKSDKYDYFIEYFKDSGFDYDIEYNDKNQPIFLIHINE